MNDDSSVHNSVYRLCEEGAAGNENSVLPHNKSDMHFSKGDVKSTYTIDMPVASFTWGKVRPEGIQIKRNSDHSEVMAVWK